MDGGLRESSGVGGFTARGLVDIATVALAAVLWMGPPLWSEAKNSCVQGDSSAAFSTLLGLPPAQAVQSPLEAEIREGISEKDFARAAELVKRMEPSADYWLWNGALLLQQGKTFKSIRSLEESARIRDTSSVETLLAVGYLLLNQRVLMQDALRAALQFDPRNAIALHLQGRLDFMTANYERAISDFGAVLAIEPNDYLSWYYLGLSEWRLARNDSAHNHLLRAVEVLNCHHWDFSQAPLTLGKLEFDSGVFDPAFTHVNLAVEMAQRGADPTENLDQLSEALVLRGKIETRLGHQHDAERDWQQAVQLDPRQESAWYLLSQLYQHQGRTVEAANALREFQENQ